MSAWRERLAWAAGFYNGEGSVGSYSPRASPHTKTITLSIGQIDRWVLDEFRSAVLGLGSILGPYAVGKPRHQFRYATSNFENVQAVVGMLWLWLSPQKRQQGAIALGVYLDSYRGRTAGRNLKSEEQGKRQQLHVQTNPTARRYPKIRLSELIARHKGPTGDRAVIERAYEKFCQRVVVALLEA